MSTTPLLDALMADEDNHLAAVMAAPEHHCSPEIFELIKDLLEDLLAQKEVTLGVSSAPTNLLSWLSYILLYHDVVEVLAGHGNTIHIYSKGQNSIAITAAPPP